ncbi:uncharacterized protein YdeI (YjbR/CyaY-like superfamily) [Leucobacter luti]|uniref:Uncharacterized protein YdeI (YjbR/CyaY-like superfamily) n=2 Tax=Leucobacter luti TaxID=340320 RepID=A0A4V2FNA4_9MICO|nr:uncharacterized protein YdeI (YjbR/CyaY-like superfamily) [Leucobacter luti]
MILPDAAAWRAWLDAHEHTSDGIWLVLAKTGREQPTSLSYAQALEEALCSGWIDGQRRARDGDTFRQRFTPRRRASIWSLRNVGIVEDLIAQQRMRDRGHAEIDRAKNDGRWERAYPGAASLELPDDVRAALAAVPGGAERFDALSAAERYPVLLQIISAPPALRARRIAALARRLGG